jgi:hypothetical protein
LRRLRATAREIGPTLPKYIVAMIISLPTSLSVDVRLRESPTVAVALTVSNATSITLAAGVTKLSSRVEATTIKPDIHTTAIALLTVCLVMLLLNKSTLSLFFTDATADAIITTIVTVLTPPAVPTGEPPINIRINDKTAEAFVRFSCGTLIKPAVLVVTD